MQTVNKKADFTIKMSDSFKIQRVRSSAEEQEPLITDRMLNMER